MLSTPASPATGVSAPAEPVAYAPSRWARFAVALPDAVGLPFLWLCVTVSTTVVLHVFSPWLVIPVTVVASAATWRWRPRFEATRTTARSATVALVGTAVWLTGNVPVMSNWLYASQDPGFIALEGFWLSRHSAPGIPAEQAAQIAAKIPGASAATGSFQLVGGQLDVQGAKLVPGLLGVGGWFGGVNGVLVANLVVGAVALLAVFALARRFAGPVWSVVAVASLAVSMPFLVFTRSAYTEPTVLALTFAGLLFCWQAMRSERVRDFLAGGALIGAGGLARVDGAAVVIGAILGLALVAFAARDDARRRRLRHGLYVATAAALALVALGWLDLRLDSPGYLDNLGTQWHELFLGLAAAVVVAVAISATHPWQPVRGFAHRHRTQLGWVAAGLVLVVAAVLVSRPLWYVGHGVQNGTVAGLQQEEGLSVDGTRTYDEQSVAWLAMYFGWIVVVAGFVGVALALARGVVRRQAATIVVVATVAAPSALYLWHVANTASQLWVMRRYLPVTMPGLLVFAAWLAHVVLARLRASAWRPRLRTWATRVAVAVAAVGFAFPLYTDARTILTAVPQYHGQLAQVRDVCAAVDGRPAVLLEDGAYFPTVRAMCGVQTFETLDEPTTDQLKQILAAFGGQSPVVVTFVPGAVPWVGAEPPATVDDVVMTWHPALNERPSRVDGGHQTIWLGTIDPTGHVVPIPPVG